MVVAVRGSWVGLPVLVVAVLALAGSAMALAVQLDTPADGATVRRSVDVRGAVNGTGPTTVDVLLDGTSLHSAAAPGPFALAWDTTTVPDGWHELTVTAANGSANTTHAVLVQNENAVTWVVAALEAGHMVAGQTADVSVAGSLATRFPPEEVVVVLVADGAPLPGVRGTLTPQANGTQITADMPLTLAAGRHAMAVRFELDPGTAHATVATSDLPDLEVAAAGGTPHGAADDDPPDDGPGPSAAAMNQTPDADVEGPVPGAGMPAPGLRLELEVAPTTASGRPAALVARVTNAGPMATGVLGIEVHDDEGLVLAAERRRLFPAQDVVIQDWSWTPEGPGTHRVVARLLPDGAPAQVQEVQVETVLAGLLLDVPPEARPGEVVTLGLGANADVDDVWVRVQPWGTTLGPFDLRAGEPHEVAWTLPVAQSGDLRLVADAVHGRAAVASLAVVATDPERMDATSFLVVGLGVACLAGALWAHRRRWSIPFLVPLFSRIPGDRVLEQETRRRVHDAIAAEPGIHYRELCRLLELGHGVVEHHLRTLEREALVHAMQDGRERRYFAQGVCPVSRIDGIQAAIVGRLDDGSTMASLARRLGVPRQRVHYHVGRLQERGIITSEKRGPMCLLRLHPGAPVAKCGPCRAVLAWPRGRPRPVCPDCQGAVEAL